jgi:hypothetical protein
VSSQQRSYNVAIGCMMCGTELTVLNVPKINSPAVLLPCPNVPDGKHCSRCGSTNVYEIERVVNITRPPETFEEDDIWKPRRGRPPKWVSEARARAREQAVRDGVVIPGVRTAA